MDGCICKIGRCRLHALHIIAVEYAPAPLQQYLCTTSTFQLRDVWIICPYIYNTHRRANHDSRQELFFFLHREVLVAVTCSEALRNFGRRFLLHPIFNSSPVYVAPTSCACCCCCIILVVQHPQQQGVITRHHMLQPSRGFSNFSPEIVLPACCFSRG